MLTLIRSALWALALTFVTASIVRVGVGDGRRNERPATSLSSTRMNWRPIPADSLTELADRIVGADAFRVTRQPSPIKFGAAAQNASPLPPKPPKPPLALAGTIGGPPWLAVLDGIPGHDESVILHVGDTVAGLRVRSVVQDRVVVTGLDTTWLLHVRHPWP